MKFVRTVKLILFLVFLFFFGKNPVLAVGNSFVSVVNPVRGEEFQANKSGVFLGNVKFQKKILDETGLSATRLLRSDAIDSASSSAYFKTFPDNHELGIFFEIMPKLAEEASINYPQGGVFWHDANKIFLSGYKPEERKELIDTTFSKFKNAFGYFPKSVGAWHIDAYSAQYMRQKYGVTGILICSDQFSTDGYQIWGGWWGVPYYPSKFNILIPAQTTKNKIGAVVFWWAARDPELAYKGSSGFSVQPNDYLGNGLNTVYFNKLLDIYLLNSENSFNQLTIGLENDYDMGKFGQEYKAQLEEVARRNKIGQTGVKTMSEFANWYQSKYQGISPSHLIGSWQMSPQYRINLKEKDGKKYIEDLRIYNEKWPEANLMSANPWGTLSLNNPYKVDSVRFGNSTIEADFQINNQEIIKRFGGQKVPFQTNNSLLFLFYFSILLFLIYFLRKSLPLLLLIMSGSASLSMTMIKSGLVYPFGMGFWGPNGHDGIWHLALINQLKNFSLENPVFSGARLTNYHFGFDLLAALLSRLTGLNPVNLYFQILPPLMAILIGVLTFKFVNKWTSSKEKAWWATFFVFFGGSWGWLVSLFKTGKFGGESMFWANQSISALINPPYALSIIILLLGLIKLLDYLEKPGRKNLFTCSLLFGVLIQVKVYAGIIVLGSLFLLTAAGILVYWNVAKQIIKITLFSFLFSLVLFLPFNLGVSSLLVFSPLWFPHTMLAYQDRLGWFKLENARIAYLNSGKWLKWLVAEALAMTIFITGNLGTRVIGLLYGGFLSKKRRKISEIEFFLFSALIVSLVIPLLFIQKGNPWNTIQFFYYFQFLMAILAGVVMGKLWGEGAHGRIKRVFVCIISATVVAFTLPTTITTLKNDYLPSRPPARVSVEELEALDFLRRQPQGNVLTHPFNKEWRNKFSEPKPLYAYETAAYVSALGEKQSFLEDEMNLEITGYNWQGRREQAQRFFMTAETEWGKGFLSDNKIKYIYLVKGQKMNLGLGDFNGEKIFENGEVVIYQVN